MARARKGGSKFRKGQVIGGDVAPDVVHRDQGHPQGKGHRLGKAEAHQHRADKARGIGHRHRVDVLSWYSPPAAAPAPSGRRWPPHACGRRSPAPRRRTGRGGLPGRRWHPTERCGRPPPRPPPSRRRRTQRPGSSCVPALFLSLLPGYLSPGVPFGSKGMRTYLRNLSGAKVLA